jgi:hypothetical protein
MKTKQHANIYKQFVICLFMKIKLYGKNIHYIYTYFFNIGKEKLKLYLMTFNTVLYVAAGTEF